VVYREGMKKAVTISLLTYREGTLGFSMEDEVVGEGGSEGLVWAPVFCFDYWRLGEFLVCCTSQGGTKGGRKTSRVTERRGGT